MELTLPKTARYRNVGCAPILLLTLLLLVFSCTKEVKVEQSIPTPQTISITINDNTSEQVLVK